jgi:hypothetical protein
LLDQVAVKLIGSCQENWMLCTWTHSVSLLNGILIWVSLVKFPWLYFNFGCIMYLFFISCLSVLWHDSWKARVVWQEKLSSARQWSVNMFPWQPKYVFAAKDTYATTEEPWKWCFLSSPSQSYIGKMSCMVRLVI